MAHISKGVDHSLGQLPFGLDEAAQQSWEHRAEQTCSPHGSQKTEGVERDGGSEGGKMRGSSSWSLHNPFRSVTPLT